MQIMFDERIWSGGGSGCIFAPMRTTETKLQIGTKLYWEDSPEILAGVVVRFTAKRDVVINFVSGNQLGERNFPIKLANAFLTK
jgi:hypothetical protein